MEKNESKKTARTSTRRGRKPEGLGDTIEQITTATGIKKVVDWFSDATGVDCGCDARKEKLNKIFPYQKPECLTQQEYEFIESLRGKSVIRSSEQTQINATFNRVFHEKAVATNCGSCLAERIKKLQSVASAYKNEESA
jgi:hypothetical protein